MAELSTSLPTLLDLSKRMDPNGTMATIIELLSKQNEITDDIPWREGNLPTGHRTTLRTKLPTIYYRRFNQGVPISKSITDQIEESCAMMEARSHVDMELIKLYGNQAAAFRASEDTAFMEAMVQQFAQDLFTGNVLTNPDRFNGFATRYNDVNFGESVSTAKDGAVVDGGGTGSDNSSIWLVCWGDDSVFGLYPKGMEAGMQMRDLGEDEVLDASGNPYQAMKTLFQWKVGLCIRDWRCVVRIANLDNSNLATNSSAADLFKLMGRAVDRLPNPSKGRPVWYVNRAMKSYLREQALQKATYTLTQEQVGGNPVLMMYGYPIRTVDVLGIAESQLT